jgi:hypothetical protein
LGDGPKKRNGIADPEAGDAQCFVDPERNCSLGESPVFPRGRDGSRCVRSGHGLDRREETG